MISNDDSGILLNVDEYAELLVAVKKHTSLDWANELGKHFEMKSGDNFGFLAVRGYRKVLMAQSPKICDKILKGVRTKRTRDFLFQNLPQTFRLEVTAAICTLPKLSPELKMLYDMPADATKN
jgi:hypothetical protein